MHQSNVFFSKKNKEKAKSLFERGERLDEIFKSSGLLNGYQGPTAPSKLKELENRGATGPQGYYGLISSTLLSHPPSSPHSPRELQEPNSNINAGSSPKR